MTKFGSLYSGIPSSSGTPFCSPEELAPPLAARNSTQEEPLTKGKEEVAARSSYCGTVLFSAATARFPTERSLVATVGPQ